MTVIEDTVISVPCFGLFRSGFQAYREFDTCITCVLAPATRFSIASFHSHEYSTKLAANMEKVTCIGGQYGVPRLIDRFGAFSTPLIGVLLKCGLEIAHRLRRTHVDPEPIANQHHRTIAVLPAYFTYKTIISSYSRCTEGY